MRDEIKDIVKEEFDYEIPMVLIEKAAKDCSYGIDENQLRKIADEYTAYRKKNKLPLGEGTPYAAQTGGVGFHSFPGEGAVT